jgi:uncharacterized repeat protein (TIGR01451 family)
MILGWGSRSRSVVGTNPSSIQTLSSQSLSNQSALPAVFGSAPLSRTNLSEAKLGVQARSVFEGLPLMFEPNQGQGNLDAADPRVKFVARGSGYSLFLGAEGAILNLKSQAPKNVSKRIARPVLARVDSLRMKLAGSNPNAALTATDLLPSTSNYLLGNDPAKWRRGVPQFARVCYDSVYPGINLIFYGHQGQLEYDFQVAPGSDPSQAELEFDGAKRVELDHGSLVIESEGGDVRLEVPRVYQEVAGRQQPIEGKFVLRAANRVGFAIGPYDHSRELVIDPVLKYSTYFGGSGDEHATSIAVDNFGDIYLAGSTTSANLPTAIGVDQTALVGTQNVYIAKINIGSNLPAANQLIYVTYLGGDGIDSPVGVSVDGAGNPYVAGTTTSDNFPTSALAYQHAPEAGSTGTKHVFVTELNNVNGIASSLIYSSYLSGSGDDIASGVAIDGSGYIYVTGTTTSVETSTLDMFPASNLPQTLPFQNSSKAPGLPQFFVTKVYTVGAGTSSVPYSTYFGGGSFETTVPIAVGGGITVDLNGNVYFTGTTNYTYTGTNSTTDFPILNAYQPCLDTPPPPSPSNPETCSPASSDSGSDAFVTKLNPTKTPGQQLQWSTYFGGANTDSGTGIVVDPGATSVYITGTTNSPGLTPVTTAFSGYQICLNTPMNPTPPCPSPSGTPPTDAFVAKFANAATSTTIPNIPLTYFSYLGGSGNEAGNAISVDSSSGALVTGSTQSTDFPVLPNPNTIQSQLNGAQDAFVARLNSVTATGQNTSASWANYFGGSGIDEGTGITIDSTQAIYFAGDTNSTDLQAAGGYQLHNNGGYDAFATQLVTAANLSISGTLLASNQGYVSAGNQATFTYTLTNNGPDLASSITVTDDISTAGVGISVVSASTTSGPPCSVGGSTTLAVSCSIPSLQAGSTATITMILVPTATTNGSSSSFNGGAVTATAANSSPVQTTVFAQMSDFTMTAGPNSFAINNAGDSARYTIQLTPHPIYSGSIALTCTGLPNASSCPFTTSPVTLPTTSPGATTMTITTTARPVVTTRVNRLSGRFFAIWLSLPGLALVGFGAGGRRRRRIAGLFLMCFLCGLLLLQPACSNPTQQVPPSGTQAGTYYVTIAATSGSDTKNYTVQLIVP